VAVIVSSRLATVNPELEDAAMDLGATRLGALRLEVLPLLWPAIAGASVLTFVISFDNFITTFFTAGVNDVPLPLRIYSMLRFGVTPIVNAVGVLMTVITVGGAVLAFVLLRMARRNVAVTNPQEALT
jgi:ABC-type spermidine/putrescine transport system permease subunit II